MSLALLPPISPFRGLRSIDAFGGGGWGAPRDGGIRRHVGLDFVAAPGDPAVAPCSCTVTHVGIAYPNADLGSLHLAGTGDFVGWALRLLYVRPEIDTIVGSEFGTGGLLGTAQAVAAYWQAQHPERGRMTGHVHVELRIDGRVVDPTPHFAYPETV